MKLSKKRQAIYDKSGGKCWYCGCELVKGWHGDHFHPIKRINTKWMSQEAKEALKVDYCEHPERDTEENKVPSCASCNIMKGQMNVEQFRTSITQFVESLNLYSNQYKFAKKYGLVVETDKPVVFWFENR